MKIHHSGLRKCREYLRAYHENKDDGCRAVEGARKIFKGLRCVLLDGNRNMKYKAPEVSSYMYTVDDVDE